MKLGRFITVMSGASDTVAPTVAITSTETSPSNAATIPLTITFSESVTGFAVGDITVAGCTLSGFSGSGAVYTVTATPTAYSMTVDIAAGVCTDAAGNANLAATQFTMTCLIKWYLAAGVNPTQAYRAVGAASLAASKVNLFNPGTNDLAAGSNPTFDTSYGWDFGAGKYLVSGVVPPDTTLSVFVRYSAGQSDANSRSLIGSYNGATQALILQYNNSAGGRAFFNGAGKTVAGVATSGVMGIAGNTAYVDGVAQSGNIGAGTAPTGQIYVGGVNAADTLLQDCGCKIQAVIFYVGTSLNPTQAAAISAAMALLP